MKTYGVMEVQLHSFLTLTLDGDGWSASRLGHLKSTKIYGATHWICSSVGFGVSL